LDFRPEDNDNSDWSSLSEQRYSEDRPWFEKFRSIFVFWISSKIRDVDGLTLQNYSTGDTLSSDAGRVLLKELFQLV